MHSKDNWWKKPMRALQYNLQVKDTPGMVPEEIAAHLEKVHANMVIINAGGIYAWYDTKIPFHHKNEYLPESFDLLSELINCCHARNIKVVFRFDWSLAEDAVWLQHPEWFALTSDKKPMYKGKDRMGNWSFLMTTCINSGYRNSEVAGPAMKEALSKYDADGIFFNNPFTPECHCIRCRNKYRNLYGEDLPDDPENWNPGWRSQCLVDNIEYLQSAVRSVKNDVPFILYYAGIASDGKPFVDNLDERFKTAELICTEAQNEAARGIDRIPPIWKPSVNMKLGNAVPGHPKPFGIIHSCPGMDWRHTGLPKDEYLYWMAQVPANNAYLWHSVTGYPDTITDKRLLDAVEEIDIRIEKSEDLMENAVSAAKLLLLWNGGPSAAGYVEGFTNMQIQYDLMDIYHLDAERMSRYEAVVLPDGFSISSDLIEMLENYVLHGGHLIMERTSADGFESLLRLSGCSGIYEESTTLSSAYLRLETEDPVLRKDLENVSFIPLCGQTLYLRPADDTKTLLSLVPPFAPPDGVGAPPERASLSAPQTELGEVLYHPAGKGYVITLAFGLSMLLRKYHLEDHHLLLRNLVFYTVPDNEFIPEVNTSGILANVYHSDEHLLIHLINGIGKRPRIGHFPIRDYGFSVLLPENTAVSHVSGVIESSPVSFSQEGRILKVVLSSLDIWEMIDIKLK